MTVPTTQSSVTAQGNGVTVNWPFAFLIPGSSGTDQTNVVVKIVDETVTPPLTTTLAANQYSVSGINVAGGGSVLYPLPGGTALAAQQFITIARNLSLTQGTSIPNQGGWFPKVVESALDYVTMLCQQIEAQVGRSLQIDVSDPAGALNLLPVNRANLFLGFDANGQPVVGNGAAGTPISGAMLPVVQAASLALARAALGSGAIGDQLYTVATNVLARQIIGAPFSNINKPGASPYASVAGDAGKLISSESAGGALIVNLAAGATYGVGTVLTFYRLTNNLTVNTNGAERIQGLAGEGALATLMLVNDGDTLTIGWDGAQWKVTAASNAVWALIGGSAAIAGGFKNLKTTFNAATPNTKFDISADAITLEDAAGAQVRAKAVAVTVDATVVGANGIDAGALGASSWYAKWLIYNPATNTLAGLVSLSGTAPAMPAGYTFKVRVGWLRTTAGSIFIKIIQYGRRAQYIVDGAALTGLPQMASSAVTLGGGVSAPTWVAIATANFVPTTAARIAVVLSTGGNDSAIVSTNASYGGVGSTNPAPLCSNTGLANFFSADLALETTNLFWAETHGTGAAQLYALGWEDNL